MMEDIYKNLDLATSFGGVNVLYRAARGKVE